MNTTVRTILHKPPLTECHYGKFHGYSRNRRELRKLYKKSGIEIHSEISALGYKYVAILVWNCFILCLLTRSPTWTPFQWHSVAAVQFSIIYQLSNRGTSHDYTQVYRAVLVDEERWSPNSYSIPCRSSSGDISLEEDASYRRYYLSLRHSKKLLIHTCDVHAFRENSFHFFYYIARC